MATVISHAKDKASPRDATMTRSGTSNQGLTIDAVFCPESVSDPFDTVEWELRSAAIKDENGEVLFEQKDCEIPASWSQLAISSTDSSRTTWTEWAMS